MQAFLEELLRWFGEFLWEVVVNFVLSFMTWRLAIVLALTAVVSSAIIYLLYFHPW